MSARIVWPLTTNRGKSKGKHNPLADHLQQTGLIALPGARFVTAAALVNELIEAKQHGQVRKLMRRWIYDLIALDEVGYVPLADVGAEFLFRVISDRAERAALIVTTNLPFSEWTSVFPNPRLCKTLLDRCLATTTFTHQRQLFLPAGRFNCRQSDRITDRAHIVETGT